ncbi:MAG: phosphoesterase [Legionellales bacterium]|nr:phosphoesterase [Legionellales bacterium]|tara:strand:- start:126 stop:389 length:264 start_codon:yes stop_codon:yes gene_type:complete
MMITTPDADASWRDSAREAKLWIFNANSVFPFLLMLYNIQTWTVVLACSIFAALTILGYYGLTVRSFLRLIRSFIAGARKTSHNWWE